MAESPDANATSSQTDLPPAHTAEQAMQDLAYAVSHDLGASVRAVRGFSDLLAKRYGGQLDAEGQKFLRLISEGAASLQEQVAALLTYSRVVSHGQPPRAVSVANIWQKVLDSAAAQIESAKAQIETGPLPIIAADPAQLEQLLSELLENSLKFRGESPLRIRFAAEPIANPDSTASAECQFRFSDSGRGVDPKHHTRVFRMFQRLHPDIRGTGAGLTVAQRIVLRHGGRMWIESNGNNGTSVCFTWPLCSEAS